MKAPQHAPLLGRASIQAVLQDREACRCEVPGLRAAAVLVPLFADPVDARTHLWLIRRTEDGGAHGGQVALPGGKPCAQDVDLQATALREAWEELGIPPEQVQVLGCLDDYPTITGFRIRPFVGWIPSEFVPTPDPREVAHHFKAPLELFLQPGARNWVHWADFRRLVRSYVVDGSIVWGATAAILSSFGEILVRAEARVQTQSA
jgi:8-oxo-dGTP pyrophosphatase MutT (NUDIX family)